MNSLLQSEQQKLNKIRIKKRQDLQNVYDLLKQKNAKEDSLQAKYFFFYNSGLNVLSKSW